MNWQRLHRRTSYENPWITVVEDEVVRPDGTAGIYGVVSLRQPIGPGRVRADQRQ